MIQLTIEGTPVSWLAHQGYGRRAFNPRQSVKNSVVLQLKLKYKNEPISQAVKLEFEFNMPVPASYSAKKKASLLANRFSCTKKPDNSNLVKFMEDCLKGIVIVDDAQVVELVARKQYSAHARTVINITTLEELCKTLKTSTTVS